MSETGRAGIAILREGKIALRYLAVPVAHWFGSAGGHPKSGLDILHDRLARSPEARRYVTPLTSFYADVTIPFTRRRRLPLAAMIEVDAGDTEKVRHVQIKIDRIETLWENHTSSLPPLSIAAEMRDAIALFESGHVVYAPAFVLKETNGDAGGNATSALHLSALTSLVGSSSGGYGQNLDAIRTRIKFMYCGESEGIELVQFVNKRLATLVSETSKNNLFSDLVRPALIDAGWSARDRADAQTAMAQMKWADFKSASIEIVGSERHTQIIATCRSAATTTADLRVGAEERALAALGQNVLDVDNQDDHEVLDSLSQAVVTGDEALLIHPKLTVRFSSKARSFEEMRDRCGGCPYFMLTNMVLTYNEHLVDQSAKFIDQIQQALRQSGSAAISSASDRRGTRDDLAARVQLFENQTLHSLPNIFRYPTERMMFDQIVRQRGLGQRSEGIGRFTRALYELRKDFTDLAEREGTKRTNRLLMALGIFQVSGLFLAGLGLDLEKMVSAPALAGQIRLAMWALFALSLAIGLVTALVAIRRTR
jgi:hypothetical protein